MQKHQWRQHGIVHFKSRPIHSSSASSSSIDQPSLNSSNIEFSSQSNVQFTSPQTNSLIVKQEDNQYPTLQQESPAISVVGKYDEEVEPALSHVSRAQRPSFSFTYPEPPEAHRSSSSNERNRSVSPAIHPNRECAPRNHHLGGKRAWLGPDTAAAVSAADGTTARAWRSSPCSTRSGAQPST